MSVVLVLRLLKLLAVCGLFAGTVGAFLPRDFADRRRAAIYLAAPSLLVTWGLGFALAGFTDVSYLSTWILGSLALSFFSLQVVLFAAARDGRRTSVIAGLAITPLVLVVGLMVFRP